MTVKADNITVSPGSSAALHGRVYAPQLIATALNLDDDRPLLATVGHPPLSVKAVREQTSRYVRVLSKLGVSKGVRVALLSSNRLEVIHVINALGILGALSVALHPMGAVGDHLYVLEDADISILLFDPDLKLEGARQIKQLSRHPVRLLSFGPSPIAEDLCAMADAEQPTRLEGVKVAGKELHRLSYTGGTTGRPKGIVSNFDSYSEMLASLLSDWEWPQPPRALVCAPLSHVGQVLFMPTLLKGGTLFVLPGGFDAGNVLRAIETNRINCLLLAPTMIYALLDHPDIDRFDLTSIQTIFYGASLMSPTRLKEAIERFGPVFAQFYGQGEAPMVVTYLRRADHLTDDLNRLASCGRPTAWASVALLDDDCEPVAEGAPGEICVRGPLVMDGYFNRPEETAAAFKGGWLHTGDIAVRDAEGILRIVDRKKDMIVSGGFNVFPREVEDVLSTHPAVAQVAVIGVPDPKWGEAVKAYIVHRPDVQASEAELIALVRERKGPVQAPKMVEFVTSLPLTAVGKVDKKALRQLDGQRRLDNSALAASPIPRQDCAAE
jgi:fatty-acyl-CoA synthase